MLKNYLSIAYRNLLKNSLFSFVNIFGLAVGMAAFLFIVQYVRFERSYENFHENADNIYRITLDLYNGSEFVITDCETHASVGPLLKKEMPEVNDFVRMFGNDGQIHVKAGNQKFLESRIYFSDPSVFRIFTYNVIHGDRDKALTEPFQAVLTESVARKYFGRTDVVDESVEIDKNIYKISGVIGDIPENTHLKFSLLLSHPTLPRIKNWYTEDGWNGNNEFTYLLMAPGTNLEAFNKKLASWSAKFADKIDHDRYVAEPVKDIHLYSNKSYEPEANGSAKVVYYLMVIAGIVIAIAWVNYINLSTARAVERAREVGIRKVMGSVKSQLVLQFISESIIVNLLAGVFAFIIYQTGLPIFRELTAQPHAVNMGDHVFWIVFAVLVVAGSTLSGIYPAFVLASFQPAAVLKGKFRSSSHGQQLRKGLVIFQFAATVVLIICMCTVYLQVNHLRTYDLGMNIEQTLIVRAPQYDRDSVFRSNYQTFKTELLQRPEIALMARSETLPGIGLHELNTTSIKQLRSDRNEGYEYYYFSVDDSFIPALDMKFVEGRNFQNGVPNHDQVIINEEAVKRLGFANAAEAIGSRITFRTRWESESSAIIGVIRNFYQRSPKEEHLPMMFYYSENAGYFSFRLKSQNIHETITAVKQTWEKIYPGSLFDYFFLDEKYDQQYKADAQFGQVMAAFSGLIIFIACLGLFGLSSYTIVQRTREIGIRKVLGASITQIVQLLSVDLMKIVTIAALLALPIAYFVMEEWLSGYAVRICLNLWIFLLPVIAILIVALSTVSFQTIKTALSNPTEALKQE